MLRTRLHMSMHGREGSKGGAGGVKREGERGREGE